MAWFYSGEIQRAKTAYEDALKQNPFHIQLLNDMATACEQTGDPRRAIQYYTAALAITPDFSESLLNISASYFNTGRKDSAFIFIDRLYGIKLSYSQQKSYDNFLPVILRQKMLASLDSIPDSLKTMAYEKVNDGRLLAAVYKNAKVNQIPVWQAFRDAMASRGIRP